MTTHPQAAAEPDGGEEHCPRCGGTDIESWQETFWNPHTNLHVVDRALRCNHNQCGTIFRRDDEMHDPTTRQNWRPFP
ncbi:hypothetical protein [Streptomyces sp. NPDC001933]|uniref:hypothetical protein n=1 Tax=Streptomyces sp. NPDC001933 TaxID=3364626 RepID=UPI0036AF7880